LDVSGNAIFTFPLTICEVKHEITKMCHTYQLKGRRNNYTYDLSNNDITLKIVISRLPTHWSSKYRIDMFGDKDKINMYTNSLNFYKK
jgi:hypothetical protein